jgi:geranylgeranyl diphosphate synthase type II
MPKRIVPTDRLPELSVLSFEEARDLAERQLLAALPTEADPPTRLHLAMREAVCPGGKRTRPVLTLLVAGSYFDFGRIPSSRLAMAGRMAAAIELVHCASLVHDDLPAFDDADTRRGRPSCHAAFGEPTAILVGDALLTLAFETLATGPIDQAAIAVRLAALLARATGSKSGIIGGQGLELQTNIDLVAYHSQKTSSLFRAAAAGGAIAVGRDEDVPRWSRFGELLGRALQLRDDLDDCLLSAAAAGKPVGRDAALGRPNAANQSSIDETREQLDRMTAEAESLLGEPGEANATLRALIKLISGAHVRHARTFAG